MTIRHLVAAALFVSAGVAHADAISAGVVAPPNFLSGWTSGNGTDVLGSGVLAGNLNLIGGVGYDTNSTLTDVLYGKAAANVGQVEGQTKIFFKRGIEGSYLLGSGHGILAASLGTGKSVVGSADGAVISDVVINKVVGGGNATAGNGGSNNGIATNPISTGQVKPAGQVNNPGVGNPFNVGSNTSVNGAVGGSTGVNGAIGSNAVEVPEPSSVMLMLAGMLGAGALTRRRNR